MALTEADIAEAIAEWELLSAYSVNFDEVEMGLRPTRRACQYFLSGLASRCQYWDSTDYKCTFGSPINPSHYNNGNCDSLGRASKCSQYKSTGETDEGYYCVAPNMYLCGLGSKDADGFFHPIPISQIKGYNEVAGVGRCDGEGKGTGTCGYAEGGDPDICPVICNYYKPHQMGFGGKEPQSFESVLKGESAPTILDRRLPFTFHVYNLRASLQKCMYWESKAGKFGINADGRITIDVIPMDICTYGIDGGAAIDPGEAWDYLEMDGNSPEWILDGVWANGAGCIVCNGAKQECPHYTEKWNYPVDDKMQDGDKISAQQIMELRYWLKFWTKQSEYEYYFNNIRPNRSDPTTSSIFTFLKWKRLGETSADAIGIGSKVRLLINPEDEEEDAQIVDEVDGYNFGLGNSVKKSEAIDGDFITFIGATLPEATVYLVNTTIAGMYLNAFDDKDLKNMLTVPIDIGYPSEEDIETKEFTDANLRITTARYQKLGQEIGTKSTQEGVTGQVSFPSLIRDISKIRTNNDDENKKIDFYRAVSRYVRDLLKNFPEFIKSAQADKSGYFVVGPLPLKYQTNNRLVLLVEVGDGTWSFKRFDIWSQWYGGLVIQDSFKNEFGSDEAGYTDSLPERFSGETTITAQLKPITGMGGPGGLYTKIGDVTPAVSTYTETILGPKTFYSYFIKSTICKDVMVEKWRRLGFSTSVMVKIDDINLNYLYFWEVISATMIEICEAPIKRRIEMKVVYPSSSSSSGNSAIQPNDDQRYIQPNMLIIKPKDDSTKIGFRNSEWQLEVTYEYTELVDEDPVGLAENEDCENIWPLINNETIFYSPAGFNIEQEEDRVEISNVNAKAVKVLAGFTDEEGRLMSVVATKLCTMVTKIYCRNVDIHYKYAAPAIGYKLIPQSGKATTIGADQVSSADLIHGFNPPCKDHEYTGDHGFVWYPFQVCNGMVVFYSCFAKAAYCAAPYGEIRGPEMYRDDYRFCGPEEYKAFTTGGSGNWAADCNVMWAYGYSKSQGDFHFGGKANIKGIVNLKFYDAVEWALPPFGNKGREMATRFISQDYHGHLSFAGLMPVTKYEWMPMVMDNEMFFTSFNAFDETAYIDCFSSYNQLNFYLSGQIEEKYVMEAASGGEGMVTSRFKFEELFDTRTFIFCSYPHPLSAEGKAVFYQFKKEEHAWAWREIWKHIERATDSDEKLSFTFLERPLYSLCRDKKYHQYICHEGPNVIRYYAPEFSEVGISRYPAIALGKGPKRYFNPLYGEDGYGTQRVEWKDVEDGMVGGNPGGIYHKITESGNWNHDENLIFDSEAVDNDEIARKAGREFKDPMDAEKPAYAYNRGVIANLYRNRLKYMPFFEKTLTVDYEESEWFSHFPKEFFEYKGTEGRCWGTPVKVIYDVVKAKGGEEEEGVCISKIEIKGSWGATEDILFCTPGVEVRQGVDVESSVIVSQPEFKFVKLASEHGWGKGGSLLAPYLLEIELDVSPFKMIDAESKKKNLFIFLETKDNQSINVSEITFYEAEYVNAIENVMIWEQKYIVSEGSDFGDYNLNGPESTLSFERNMENSGQYFPAGPNCAYKEETETLSKMRSVYAGVETAEDTSLTVSRENLLQIEQEEQMGLYKEAYNLDEYGNKFVYNLSMPKYLSDFFDNNNIQSSLVGESRFEGERLEWDKHALYKAYKPGEFWNPKGHKFEWSKDVWTQKCKMGQYGNYIGGIGPIETVHEGVFIHMDTQKYTEVMNPGESLRTGRMAYQWEVYMNMQQGKPLDYAASPIGVGGSFVDTRGITT